jgi:dCMP deaminase
MRPDWDDFFLGLCYLIKERSPDTTKHGAIITLDNKVLSLGYNGFPSGSDDALLGLERPFKYDYALHAEANAIDHCSQCVGATIYVTGKPCPQCLARIAQRKIKRIVYLKGHNTFIKPNDPNYFEKLTKMHNIESVEKTLNIEWIKNVC